MMREVVTKTESEGDGEFWADKLMDLANLSVVGLVFGQLVTEGLRWDAVGAGLILYGLLSIISLFLRRR